MPDLRASIHTALQAFPSRPLREAATDLLSTLGYRSDRTLALDGQPDSFLAHFDPDSTKLNCDKGLVADWKRIELLFHLTGGDLAGEFDLFDENQVKQGNLQSYLFFAVELTGENYARGKLRHRGACHNWCNDVRVFLMLCKSGSFAPALQSGSAAPFVRNPCGAKFTTLRRGAFGLRVASATKLPLS